MLEDWSCFVLRPLHLVDLKKKERKSKLRSCGETLNLFLHKSASVWYHNKRINSNTFPRLFQSVADAESSQPRRRPSSSLAIGLWVGTATVRPGSDYKRSCGDEAGTRRDFPLTFQQTELISNLTLCPPAAEFIMDASSHGFHISSQQAGK